MEVNTWQGRSKTGCLICKARKVKCDEATGGCGNCLRLGLDCPLNSDRSGDESQENPRAVVETAYQNAGVIKRVVGSCQECHQSKIKCSKSRPKCQRCLKKRLSCVYSASPHSRKKPSTLPSLQPSPRSGELSRIRGESEGHLLMSQESATWSNTSLTEGDYGWLFSSDIPNDANRLRMLAEHYFKRVHPMGSMTFIHKPIFMKSVDTGTLKNNYGSALLYIICALGARHVFYSHYSDGHNKWALRDVPGDVWAKRASDLAFEELGKPTTQNLMALVLLTLYNIMFGQSSTVFMLTGCCLRLAQLLRLEAEADDVSLLGIPEKLRVTERESRRRLMWSCYILDINIGSGVDSLGSSKIPPKVHLPCPAQAFMLQMECNMAPMIFPQDQHEFIRWPNVNASLEVFYVRVMYLRGEVLRVIRYPKLAASPWEPESEFARLVSQLEEVQLTLPDHLQFNEINLYIQKEQQQLIPFYELHLIYHQCYCDLYRVTLPGYQFPITALFENASPTYIQQCRDYCMHHAEQLSGVLRSALKHGDKAINDPGAFAYESTKIQIIYATTCSPSEHINLANIVKNIEANLATIDVSQAVAERHRVYVSLLCGLLGRFGFSEVGKRWLEKNNLSESFAAGVESATPETNHLHPLATYRLAWNDISWPEKTQEDESLGQMLPPPNEEPHIQAPATAAVDLGLALPPPLAENTQVQDYAEPFNFDFPLSAVEYSQMADDMQDYLIWDPMSFGPVSNL